MAKTSSRDLFELVHALTKPEKANFKLVSAAYKNNKEDLYIKLFDVLASSQEYNEQKIIKRLQMNQGKFPDLKNYLYKRIMYSLEMFNSKRDYPTEIKSLIKQSQILIKKNLLIQARKKALKAITMAKETSLLQYELEAREVYLSSFFKNRKENELEKIYKEQFAMIQEGLDKLKEFYEIRHLHAEMFILGIKQGASVRGLREEEVRREVEKFDWLVDERNACTDAAQIMLLRQRYIYKRFRQGMEADELSQTNKIFEEKPLLKDVYYKDYLNNLHNYLYSNIDKISITEIKKGEEISGIMYELHQDNEIAEINLRFIQLRIEWFLSREKYDETIEFYMVNSNLHSDEEIKDFNLRLTLYITTSIAYIQTGKYKQALQHLTRMINLGYNNTIRIDLFCFAKILILICHFSMGNYEQLPYIAAQAKRLINKSTQNNPIYQLLIEFFTKKVKHFYSEDERLLELSQLKKKLKEAIEKTGLLFVKRYRFNYDFWLNSLVNKGTKGR